MHDYLFTTEVVRFAFMFGVAVSMLLYERRHLTTGSIVVPGYIATFLAMPLTLLASFLNAFVSYWVVNKLLRRWFLLYGRTKFTVLAMVSISIQTLMLKFSPVGSWLWESDFKLLVGVGYVVPALIAHDMGRQGIVRTFKSVMLAGVLVAIPIGIALAIHVPGVNDLAPLRGGSESAIDVAWIPIAVLLSAASAWGVARFHGLRSGGFMGAAFVAILLGDPWQVVIVAVLAASTYLFVTRLLMNSMILFGRRKFSTMLLVSSSLSWMLLWSGGHLFNLGVQRHMDLGSLALTPLIVPGLIANDSQRTSPGRLVRGLTLATAFVLSATWSIQSTIEHRRLDLGWRLLALTTGALIFGRPLYDQARQWWVQRSDPHRVPPILAMPVDIDAAIASTSYHSWANLHREAADAAERWLTSLLGEPAPLVSDPVPAITLPTPAFDATLAARHNDEARKLDRIREAAVRALRSPAPHVAGVPPAPLPVRRKPLPVRTPGNRRGEFDTITAGVLERQARQRNDRATERSHDLWVSPHGTRAPVVLPHPDAPVPAPPGLQNSEPSDATTRAHTVASDGRNTPHAFPG